MERMVWAAAFAAEFAKERQFRDQRTCAHLPLKGISGFSCAVGTDSPAYTSNEYDQCEQRVFLLRVLEARNKKEGHRLQERVTELEKVLTEAWGLFENSGVMREPDGRTGNDLLDSLGALLDEHASGQLLPKENS